MLHRRLSLFAIILLVLSVFVFFRIELTTPARMAAVAFLLLVSAYVYVYHRADVAVSCSLFFLLFAVNKYLFDHVLPIWFSVVIATMLVLIAWLLLFHKHGWPIAVATSLLVVELILGLQFTNLEMKFQTFLSIVPFMVICQNYYFDLYRIPRGNDGDESDI